MSDRSFGSIRERSGYETSHEELFALIESWSLELPSGFDHDTPLISSGLFDSLALFNLTLWIEAKIGRNIDPASVDIASEWDSMENIMRYLRRVMNPPTHVIAPPSPKPARPLPESGYQILKYDPTYKRTVAEFQRGLWSPDPDLNLRYLEWKYERNPYSNKIDIYLAFHDGALVGMRGFYASRWETDVPARQFDVLVADDLLIHEDHRHQALVTRIMRTAYEGLRSSQPRFLFNLSGSPLTVIGSFTTDWRSSGTLKPLQRRSPTARLNLVLRKALSRMPYLRRYAYSKKLHHLTELHPFARLDHAKTPFATRIGLPVDIDKQPRPKAMAKLIERIGHDGRLRHVRDEVYFDWRFRNPLNEYRFLFVGTDALDGYLVLKRTINSSSRVSIVDLEAVNDRVQSALLETAVSVGAFAELFVWTATADDELLRQLHTLKFAPIEQNVLSQPCFLVRPIEDERLNEDWRLGDTRLLDLKNWNVRMLYSMAG
jgi:acyl carrier protein